jgi:hypothetical protein
LIRRIAKFSRGNRNRSTGHIGADTIFIKKWITEPQLLTARRVDSAWTYYYAEKFQLYDAGAGTVLGIGGLRVSLTDKNHMEMFSSTGLTGLKRNPQAEITFTKITATDRPNFTHSGAHG